MLRVSVTTTLLICCISVGAGPIVPKISDGTLSSGYSEGSGASGRDTITWNQSQHGKSNVQVTFKDVKIIAILNSDEYDDEDIDYEYLEEYEDLISGTTPDSDTTVSSPTENEEEDSESSSSVSSVTTEGTTDKVTVNGNDTIKQPGSQQRPAPVLLTFENNGKPENITQLPNDPAKRAALAQLYQRDPPVKRTPVALLPCEQGFVRDILGRCRHVHRRRRPSLFPFRFNFPGLSEMRMTRWQAAKRKQYKQQQQILAS